MTPQLSIDEKVDQIQEVLVDLVKLAGKTADDVQVLKKDVSEIKDEQERQGKKLDQLTSFTPGFTSGAFVA